MSILPEFQQVNWALIFAGDSLNANLFQANWFEYTTRFSAFLSRLSIFRGAVGLVIGSPPAGFYKRLKVCSYEGWHGRCLLTIPMKGGKTMYHAILIWTASVIFSGLIAGETSFAYAVNSSEGTTTSISPPSEPGQESRALEQLAVTLAAGGGAWRSYRDSKPDDETKHPLNPTIPNMNCNVDDIANYVSCYGSAVRQKAEAERRFTALINELQAVLPPERWAGAEIEPRIGSMRSYTWGDQISDAGIDIDIVPQWSPDEEISYVVTIFGWPAISPQL